MKFTKGQTVVFFGDSVTEGCFELYKTDYGFDTVRHPELAYPHKLSGLLDNAYGEGFVRCVNSGVSGNNTRMGLARIEKDVLSYSPALVTVCFGLNDSLGDCGTYRDNLRAIFKSIISSGSKVIFITPNMMNTYIHKDIEEYGLKIAHKTMDIQNSGVMDSFVSLARDIASEYGIPVCDMYAEWKSMFENGVDTTVLLSNYINHPVPDMHDRLARSLFDKIPEI